MKRIITAIALITMLNHGFCDDAISPAAERAQAIRESKARYLTVSGKQPELNNLLSTIGSPNGKSSEVVAALDVLALEKGIDGKTANLVRECYSKHSYWLVRLKCIQVLLEAEEKAGIPLAREFLNQPSNELEGKLLLADYLVSKKMLFGYPILRQGIVSTNDYQKRLAIDLLKKFKAYEGMPWNESGEKVNTGSIATLETK